jgi:hypothetical protein
MGKAIDHGSRRLRVQPIRMETHIDARRYPEKPRIVDGQSVCRQSFPSRNPEQITVATQPQTSVTGGHDLVEKKRDLATNFSKSSCRRHRSERPSEISIARRAYECNGVP